MVALWAVAPGSMVSTWCTRGPVLRVAVWCPVALVERRWLTAAVLTILAWTRSGTAVALVAAVAVATLPVIPLPSRQPARHWWRPAAPCSPRLSAWSATGPTRPGQPTIWLALAGSRNAHNNFDFGKGSSWPPGPPSCPRPAPSSY